MYFDGSLKLQGVGAGILFIAPRGDQLKYALQLLFLASNNAAEYVRMAILPMGSDIHGYPTLRFRVRVRNLTRGSHPYPTRDKIGSGTGFIFYPRILADIRNYFQFSLFSPPETGRPNVHLYSIIQNPSPLTSRSHARSHHSPSHRSRSLTISLSASHPSHHQPPER
jgi:hypothetical protein